MVVGSAVEAWRPPVAGVAEVLHAFFAEHAYPLHTHDCWTLLLIDRGAVHYNLYRDEHTASGNAITLLPPHVPHNGRTVHAHGLRKRVLYLETDVLTTDLVGSSVDRPSLDDPVLRARIGQLHYVLAAQTEHLEAESHLVLIQERLRLHLTESLHRPRPVPEHSLARSLRDLLDERITEGITINEAARMLHTHPTHLIRSFGREFGLPPHAYLNGRRINWARRLLLDGMRPVDVATCVGFYDQAHFSRHFKKMLGVNPSTFTSQRARA